MKGIDDHWYQDPYYHNHSIEITTTTFAAIKDSASNTRELYILLDTGCSSTMLSDNYLGCVPEF